MRFLVLAACVAFSASSSSDECAGGLRENSRWKLEQDTYKPFMTNLRTLKSRAGYIFSSAETPGMKECSVELCQKFVAAVESKQRSSLKTGKKTKLMKEIILIGVTGIKNERNCRAAVDLMEAKGSSFTDLRDSKAKNLYFSCYAGGYFPALYPHHHHNNVIIVNANGGHHPGAFDHNHIHHDSSLEEFVGDATNGIQNIGNSAVAGLHQGASHVKDGVQTAYSGISGNENVRSAAYTIQSHANGLAETAINEARRVDLRGVGGFVNDGLNRAQNVNLGEAANSIGGDAQSIAADALNAAENFDCLANIGPAVEIVAGGVDCVCGIFSLLAGAL